MSEMTDIVIHDVTGEGENAVCGTERATGWTKPL